MKQIIERVSEEGRGARERTSKISQKLSHGGQILRRNISLPSPVRSHPTLGYLGDLCEFQFEGNSFSGLSNLLGFSSSFNAHHMFDKMPQRINSTK
ncbi:hypothetical protein TIFTF001_009943 [Ficus carica]|uniref:Uncharacterized protein n=1 Tax=Ficus carica TaxID=3494 RepID=A0AA88DHL0_FICCA|nr:hypothetical protein TIFTF001_009943 [Ficus carica]